MHSLRYPIPMSQAAPGSPAGGGARSRSGWAAASAVPQKAGQLCEGCHSADVSSQ